MDKLLTRDEFRQAVQERDGHKCVVCSSKSNLDSHHILERRLFDDGGYYLDNGATLCGSSPYYCHLRAERTLITCDELRKLCGIDRIILPPQLYDDQIYDKWGNAYLPNGQRLIGELFFDESVQKVLESVLGEFTHYVKYPRSWHVPDSPGVTKDDRVLKNLEHFNGKNVVVSIKHDGECSSLYNDYFHARSIDSEVSANAKQKESRSHAKTIWGQVKHNIPERWRVCAENMYAKHTIQYNNLESYLLVFSIWNERNICLSWDDTVEYAELLGLRTVPVIYSGEFDYTKIKTEFDKLKTGEKDDEGNNLRRFKNDIVEGFVIRTADEFRYADFRHSLAKWVRPSHVPIHASHWLHKKLEKNLILE